MMLGITFLIPLFLISTPQKLKTKNKTFSSFLNDDLEASCKILGVSLYASEIEIKEAYYRLMKKNHPDHGGNLRYAQNLNWAKEILLKNLRCTSTYKKAS